MRRVAALSLCVVLALAVGARFGEAVDAGNFKKCGDAGFCRRQRETVLTSYSVVGSSVSVAGNVATFDVVDAETSTVFVGEVTVDAEGLGRFRLREKTPLVPRYEVQDVLLRELEAEDADGQTGAGETSLSWGAGGRFAVVINHDPLRLEWYVNDRLVITANDKSKLSFEATRTKPEKVAPPDPAKVADPDDETADDDDVVVIDLLTEQEAKGMWEETWKGTKDPKKNGPQSVAMDVTFVGSDHVFGIPEHADDFALETTKGVGVEAEPYRLYNLDVFEYDLDSRMALYGSIPFMVGHNEHGTAGVLWLNAAETFVDISESSKRKNSKDVHWMSETGVVDAFFMLGPTAGAVFKQYAEMTGTTTLPPTFAISYHQCRWNYRDQEDVDQVDANFDVHNIPYDVLWLDIEHTDGKRYLTWDANKFPDSVAMINAVAAKGRKMVTIVDPHVKKDTNYFVYSEAHSAEYFVKDSNGNEFGGSCWPGQSAWLDVTAKEVRDFWTEKYSLENYKGSTPDLFVWNDMNEPSVFSGPEITMPKDNIHAGGWEHRDIHNIYGHYYLWSTYEGLLKRSGGTERPFVLSRAFFAGSQRYAAIWTGDNMAEWSHLEASIPMLLSHSVAGQVFIGADVGGFFGNPDPELLVRWYQAGALQPFFRAHAHLDTKRREPWLFGEENTAMIRTAIQRRYKLLPYIYTLFEEASQTNMPVMRPMWVHYPRDASMFATEDQYLLGEDILVHPVTAAGATTVDVAFPGSEPWYDTASAEAIAGGQTLTVSAPLEKIPVYQRGGSIVPTKNRPRRSSAAMAGDPYTLNVALDSAGEAAGALYIDDGHSFEYTRNMFARRFFTFKNGVLSNKAFEPSAYETSVTVERVLILGVDKPWASAELRAADGTVTALDVTHNAATKTLVVRKPDAGINDDWEIVLTQ